MGGKPIHLVATLALAMGMASAAPLQAQQDAAVPAFVQAWRSAQLDATNAARTWATFAEAHPGHDLARVATFFQGMTLLSQGADPPSAIRYFVIENLESDKPVSVIRRQLTAAARAMHARIAMAKLADRLQEYYATKVEYPASLDELVSAKLAKADEIVDPFGQRFDYQPKPRRIMPDIPRQAYTLRCVSIDVTHGDLAKAARQAMQPVGDLQVSSLAPREGHAFVRRRQDDGTFGRAMAWDVDSALDRLTLWAVYDDWLLRSHAGFPQVMVKE